MAVNLDEATACILEAATHRLKDDKQFSFQNKRVEIQDLKKAIGVEGIAKLNRFYFQKLESKLHSEEIANCLHTHEELYSQFGEDLKRVEKLVIEKYKGSRCKSAQLESEMSFTSDRVSSPIKFVHYLVRQRTNLTSLPDQSPVSDS